MEIKNGNNGKYKKISISRAHCSNLFIIFVFRVVRIIQGSILFFLNGMKNGIEIEIKNENNLKM